MKAVHFGAGNIGRGFIGQILAQNDFEVTFVDINDTIIQALKDRQSYQVGIADDSQAKLTITGVTGLNNQKEPEKVIEAIAQADLVTTAIGPKILPFIAELIAKGIQVRGGKPLDVIACENMIGGSQFLKSEVEKYCDDLSDVGFPNAAVDRIVPVQHREDPLFVSVEPFCEWCVDQTQMKNPSLRLEGVHYVDNLEPYIERKLFSVNTGHATVAYTGAELGYHTVKEALADRRVEQMLKDVLAETGALIVAKWGFNQDEHHAYLTRIISRFKNPYLSDDLTRVGRTPIRKLGYDERFIRPIREAKQRGLSYVALANVVMKILNYQDEKDAEAVQLQAMVAQKGKQATLVEVSGLSLEEVNRIWPD